jgi:hypothetical protein
VHSFENTPTTHESLEPLRKTDTEAPRPFSHSYFSLPFDEMIAATRLLWRHLCSNKESTGFTGEDLKYLNHLEQRLKDLQKKDRKWRLSLDLVLRCLHPDGCYFPYLDQSVVLAAYQMCDVDPVMGVNRLPLRDPTKVGELEQMLLPHLEKLERKFLRW